MEEKSLTKGRYVVRNFCSTGKTNHLLRLIRTLKHFAALGPSSRPRDHLIVPSEQRGVGLTAVVNHRVPGAKERNKRISV